MIHSLPTFPGISRLDDQIFINRNPGVPSVVKFHPFNTCIAVADKDSIWWDARFALQTFCSVLTVAWWPCLPQFLGLGEGREAGLLLQRKPAVHPHHRHAVSERTRLFVAAHRNRLGHTPPRRRHPAAPQKLWFLSLCLLSPSSFHRTK